MARVLIAWELGEAFGHLVRCLSLAETLSNRGHTVVLALKDVRLPGGEICPSGITVLQAPLTPQRRSNVPLKPVNYAGLLHHCGFSNPLDLAARLVGWKGVFTLAKPEVVIADHAPTALLAAELSDISHVAIGNAFAIPPDVTPWPSIRPWETIPASALVLAERHLDNVTSAAQKLLGHTRIVRVRELYGRHDLLETFAELDHYGARPLGRYIGPIVCAPKVNDADWQDEDNAKILAYIRPEVPGFKAIIAALAGVDAEVLCVTPGLAPKVARECATSQLRISLVPLGLPSLLSRADLAVSYGNCGFSTQSLLAGVPLLMSPIHVEQGLFARRVELMGAGKLLTGHTNTQHVQNHLEELLHTPEYRQAAVTFRDRYPHFSPAQAIESWVSLVEEAIAGTHSMPVRELQE
tara:strand:+ start:407 stop:1633 length:1227 start_codon:yes stop_codon:yes gene_type:complete